MTVKNTHDNKHKISVVIDEKQILQSLSLSSYFNYSLIPMLHSARPLPTAQG